MDRYTKIVSRVFIGLVMANFLVSMLTKDRVLYPLASRYCMYCSQPKAPGYKAWAIFGVTDSNEEFNLTSRNNFKKYFEPLIYTPADLWKKVRHEIEGRNIVKQKKLDAFVEKYFGPLIKQEKLVAFVKKYFELLLYSPADPWWKVQHGIEERNVVEQEKLAAFVSWYELRRRHGRHAGPKIKGVRIFDVEYTGDLAQPDFDNPKRLALLHEYFVGQQQR